MVDLLEQIILEPCYDVLRTKEQLGYTVSCGMRHTVGVLGFCVLVQSSTYGVQHILQRIDNFLVRRPQIALGGEAQQSSTVLSNATMYNSVVEWHSGLVGCLISSWVVFSSIIKEQIGFGWCVIVGHLGLRATLDERAMGNSLHNCRIDAVLKL